LAQRDSYRLVYETYREHNWELVLVNADGSNPVNLTQTPDVNELYPHVSLDGTKISFLVNSGKGAATRRGAWYMNLDGTGRTKVADDVREACWSPDDGRLRVLRGGAWNSQAPACRPTSRAAESPGFQDACLARDAIGFRCVRRAP